MARLYHYLTRHCAGCQSETTHAFISGESYDYFCIECHGINRHCLRCAKTTWHRLKHCKNRLVARCLPCTRPLSPLNLAVRQAILRSVKSGESYTSIARRLKVTVTRVRRHVDKINGERKRAKKPPLKGIGPQRKLTDADRAWLVKMRNRLKWQRKKVTGAILAKMLLSKYGKRIHRSTIDRMRANVEVDHDKKGAYHYLQG